jgi:hypothetical protein
VSFAQQEPMPQMENASPADLSALVVIMVNPALNARSLPESNTSYNILTSKTEEDASITAISTTPKLTKHHTDALSALMSMPKSASLMIQLSLSLALPPRNYTKANVLSATVSQIYTLTELAAVNAQENAQAVMIPLTALPANQILSYKDKLAKNNVTLDGLQTLLEYAFNALITSTVKDATHSMSISAMIATQSSNSPTVKLYNLELA